ncbi:MAG: hypothetical protein IH944_09790 [Armatimonadetes bacterium]|nr:hypothetical protein [Armatimonadota bacterium]
MSRYRIVPALAFAVVAPAIPSPAPAPESSFTLEERAAVVEYWSQPGRYEAKPLGEVDGTDIWFAKYTPEGSLWIREFYRLRSDGKVIPTITPEAENEQQLRWDNWLNARVARDRLLAEIEAEVQNAIETGDAIPIRDGSEAPAPGEMPADLAGLIAAPPNFFHIAIPYAHTIRFDDATIEYQDHVGVPDKYAYFRNEKGVRSFGTKAADRGPDYINLLYQRAGIPVDQQRVFAAVSLLEGGFDSVNTYDTGFVSVGFIQFAALSEGAGSLGQVMLRMKTEYPEEFEGNFRRFGLDVTDDGVLVVADPTVGAELHGPDANQRIIHDKRLIAVFQRAGQLSDEFNVCQILTARDNYYPADDEIVVEVGGREMKCLVKDIFKSEAGLATMMDRKVNTGKLDPLGEYLRDLVEQTGMTDLKDAAKYEWALIRAMKYREDYLAMSALSQPARLDITLSRGDNPRDRRGGG